MPHRRDAIIELENLEQLSRAELRALWTKEGRVQPRAKCWSAPVVRSIPVRKQAITADFRKGNRGHD
jgi:hypothetical protein